VLTVRAARQLITNLEAANDRLLETITRKKIDQFILPIETSLQSKIAKLFSKQGSAVVKALTPIKKYLTESATSDFNELFDTATLDTSADMQEAIATAVSKAVVIGGKSLLSDFRSSIVFSLTNPRAVTYTKDHAAEAITGIDDHSKADIRTLVLLAVEHGTSYATLAKQIKDRYQQFAIGVPQQHIRSRAELIAVTEVGNAYQAGNYVAAATLEDSGITLEKFWYNRGDNKVSAGCKENTAAGWIDLASAFPSGHMTPLRFPGCRCAAQYRRKKS
jgi:hypothetical protein